MALSTQPYKGARDFYPEDKRLQKYMFSLMRRVAEEYGYEEYDAPVLEPVELYLAKTGEEIVNEQTYVFTDRGARQVVIRPEMTPTVSRMVAGRRQELAYPVRWYSIPNLWRYERPQRGRLREHWQLNVDIFGVDNHLAEAEVIQVADGILKAAGATHDMYSIKLNSRKLMDYILHEYLGLDGVQGHTIAKLIDRMHKMPADAFSAEVDAVFTPTQREKGASNKLMGLLKTKTLEHLPEVIRQHSSALELKELLHVLKEAKITNARFDLTVMRGFDYYTGIVFEIFDEDPENNRSMLGGGRYDGLVGLFGVEPVPTVGFGFGDVTFENFLKGHDLLPPVRVETDVYVVLIGAVYADAQRIIARIREMGANVAVDLSGRSPDKQIKTAVKKGVHYALFIGEKELREEQFEIKNLMTGVAEKHSLERIVSIVKDYRD
ncbi:MAG TPA: histidine--tRNA ligase [Candidatus Saccharimonadales bacterium]|jgi:histidyl-tRNA synthetase|nr:histidine--tRNA ligase [Candidatus Saccharimonadales bacterium]